MRTNAAATAAIGAALFVAGGLWGAARQSAPGGTGGPQAPVGGRPPASSSQAAMPGAPVPILWLEPVGAAPQKGELPLYRPIPSGDPRFRDAERLVDNEAALFTRTLVAWAWNRFAPPAGWTPPRLPIVLAEGGNNAAKGFRLQAGDHVEDHPDVPLLLLALDSNSLSNTFIHEGGHLLHDIATSGKRPSPWWTATVHSTFAVTDPLTALAEGFAIHFETLWAHFGKQPEMRAFYHRLAPSFDAKGRRAEFYAPIADLMTFSQTWARYQAVRETWTVFAGHLYPGEYLRSQYDPARDRAVLKSAGAMVASEGAAASALFWTVASMAQQAGAKPADGLAQQQLLEAEQAVLEALSAATPAAKQDFRPDIVDVVSAIGEPGSTARTLAVSRFVSVTRGVTARPGIRGQWTALYHDALALDFDATRPLFGDLDAAREAILQAAWKDPLTLRAMIGPVVPVRAPKVRLELKMIGRSFELDFDLNAAGEAEWLAAGVDGATAKALVNEGEKRPFSSVGDFEKRTGRRLSILGLVSVDRE